MKTMRNEDMPYMRSMAFCLEKVTDDGYTAHFSTTGALLQAENIHKSYSAGQVKLVNFFRFQGVAHPEENAVLYVIETIDGVKGTLIDNCAADPESVVNKFILAVQSSRERS